MHILTEITCKWTDAVSVSCMFIVCTYILEKNTAYLCMSSPDTTSPEQRINISDLKDSKTTEWHEQNYTKPDGIMTFGNPGQEGINAGHISFPFSIMATRESMWSERKNKTKRIWTALGCSFVILLACVRVVMFTALRLQEWLQWLHSIKMNIIHLLENGQNGSIWFLHECTPCRCPTTEGKRRVVLTLFHLTDFTDWICQIDSDSQAGVKVCCLWPERVKVSAHRRLKAGPLAVWDSSSCLGHRGGSSHLKAAWQWLTALHFRPAPLKRPPLCAAHPTALTVYRPRRRSHLALFLLTHNVVFGSASPCSLRRPNTWACVVSIRLIETQ